MVLVKGETGRGKDYFVYYAYIVMLILLLLLFWFLSIWTYDWSMPSLGIGQVTVTANSSEICEFSLCEKCLSQQ